MTHTAGGERPGRWSAWWRVADVLVDVTLTALVLHSAWRVVSGAPLSSDLRTVALASVLVMVAALWWRRRHPEHAAVVGFGAVLTNALVVTDFPADSEPGWTIGEAGNGHLSLTLAVLLFAVTLARPLRRAVVYLAGTLALAALPAVAGVSVGDPQPGWQHHAFVAVVMAVTMATAVLVRARRAEVCEMARTADRLRAQAQVERNLAAAEERLRIARDLHDFVAHHLSVVAVHLTVADREAAGDPHRRPAIRAARQGTRDALDGMRALVSTLRNATEDDRVPAMEQLAELIGAIEAAGLRVRVTEKGRRPSGLGLVELVAYRVVQEALTNVLRHAGVPSADLLLSWGSDAVVIRVTDRGRGGIDPPVAGHGLTGMRERVSAIGGHLEAGPRPAGGFQVEALLPYHPADPAPPPSGDHPSGRVPVDESTSRDDGDSWSSITPTGMA